MEEEIQKCFCTKHRDIKSGVTSTTKNGYAGLAGILVFACLYNNMLTCIMCTLKMPYRSMVRFSIWICVEKVCIVISLGTVFKQNDGFVSFRGL